MSGSGGGGYVPPHSSKFDCINGIIITSISSIDLNILKNLKVGDILSVELSEVETIILLNGNGETLGSIVHLNTTDLIDCIKMGNKYKAIITSINSPNCRVKIDRI